MSELIPPPDFETRVQEIGAKLFAAINLQGRTRFGSGILGGRAVQRRVLARASEDQHFKTQLFRFVDVYPSLRDSGDVVRHLRAYLADRGELPHPLDRVLGPDGDRRLPSWAVARLTERTMHRMAKVFIAGRDAKEVLPELKRLRREHTAFTLDILGEVCLSELEAADYIRRYMDVLTSLPVKIRRWSEDRFLDETPWGQNPILNVSVKLSSFYSQIDTADFEGSRRALLNAVRPLFLTARDESVFMNVDLERFAQRDLTHAVFSDLAEDPELAGYPHLGIVVQAYLRDSEQDLLSLVELARRRGTPVTVRLVKGAYWDFETITARQEHWPLPVYSEKAETDANFERLAKIMIENSEWIRPAFGTHNLRSMAVATALAEAAGLQPRAIELQVLHGMAEPIRKAAVDQRYLVREYVPVGELIPGMAYLVRRLLENTANESFLRLTFSQQVDQELLMRPPIADAPETAEEPEAPEGPTPAPVNDAPEEPGVFVNEPHADFSLAENRDAMTKALTTIQASLGREYSLLIDGKQLNTGKVLPSLNPARPDEIVGIVAAASKEHVDLALDAAARAFPAWRERPGAERAAILFRAAALMRERRFELAALEVLEAGKPWHEADADVTEAIDFVEYYGREIIRLSRVRDLSDVPGEEDLFFYEPRGVAAVIAPWNFPLAIPTGMVTAALAAGNAVVFKPAGPTPVLGYAMVRILHEAGVPEGVLNFVAGSGSEIGDHLVSDPRVDLIAFTGSLEVGLNILRQAATVAPGQRNIKRVITEMGGKNAIIVDTDADLDMAVQGVISSSFNYAGQKCSACSRVVVLDAVHDQFVSRLIKAAASLVVGDPSDPSVRVGPVITDEARQRILTYVETGQDEATLAYPLEGDTVNFRTPPAIVDAATVAPQEGGLAADMQAVPQAHALTLDQEAPSYDAETTTKAEPRAVEPDAGAEPEPEPQVDTAEESPADSATGYFVAPHIFIDTPPDATIAQEEIFGPVLVVMKAHKFKDALQLAGGVKYGLTGGVYSRNPDHIRRAVREFRVGNLYINRPITGAMVGRQPFGGSRMSGVGSKAGGPDYLLQFMEPRTVTENTIRRGFIPEE